MNRSPICLPLAGSLFALLTLAWGGPALAGFTANADGTVTDSVTGLVWDRCAWGQTWDGSTCTGSATTHSWPQALTLAVTANGSSHRGRTDWRLPSRVELESLVDLSYAIPAIDITVFPNTPSSRVWSSTPFAFDPASAWFVDFGVGYTFAFPTNSSLHVRLVRSGQSFDLLDATYAIITSVTPAAGGSVSCDVDPVNYGGSSTCTATANTGYTFAGFTGDCTGTTCTLTHITAHKTVTATFTPNSHSVTLATAGNGSGTTSGAGTYDYGTTVTLGATPAVGSHFAGWSGDAVCAGSFTMPDRTVSCTATFILPPEIPTLSEWAMLLLGGLLGLFGLRAAWSGRRPAL